MPRPSVPVALLLAALFAAGCSASRDTVAPAAAPPAAAPPAAAQTAAAQTAAETPRPARPDDAHSYARPSEAVVHHVALDLAADFEAETLAGTATLTVEGRPGATEVVLDTRDLAIERVTDAAGAPLRFAVGPSDPILGAPLTVALPPADPLVGDRPGSRLVVVHYRTAPTAAAVQWLGPAQTTSGQPFLFTQGEAILTRTWVPTQDSPGIRQTYEAAITVPANLTAVMSAQAQGEPVAAGATRTFRYALDKPVPPYLIALAVGDLAFRPIGDQTGVWAEPAVVEAAAAEFAEVDEMIEAAEALYGPYRWGRYDLLVLPPSFPFGGMENPTLTFATPTILAGDRSLVSLVAHELAHSWSGNLVTNATWSDFWLNEGFTVYFENRIMEAVYGPARAEMLRQLGRADLMAELETLPAADQTLHVDLAGRDPDDGFTSVPYDKGAAFLFTVESVVGRERLDAFLRGYFDRNAFGPDDERGPARRDGRPPVERRPGRARGGPPRGVDLRARPARATCRRCSRPRSRARRPRRRRSPPARCRWRSTRSTGPRRSGSRSCRPFPRRSRPSASPRSTATSGCPRPATARSCSRGCASRSATATSRRTPRSRRSCRGRAGASSCCRSSATSRPWTARAPSASTRRSGRATTRSRPAASTRCSASRRGRSRGAVARGL